MKIPSLSSLSNQQKLYRDKASMQFRDSSPSPLRIQRRRQRSAHQHRAAVLEVQRQANWHTS